jgi:glucose/arabinose dehydrogenase
MGELLMIRGCFARDSITGQSRTAWMDKQPTRSETSRKRIRLSFVHRFAFGLATSVLLLSGLAFSVAAATLPAGFVETQIGGLSAPTAMDFAPDGRLFVCLKGGSLRVIKNGALLPTPFLTVTVDSAGERGLLGIAFDPNFATNNFVYVYYTVPGSPAHNRVSRFTANGDVAVPGSELPILDLNNLSGASNHNGGAIHFGPDGKLYIAVGENANGANSQTLTNLLGKILRINADGTPPNDNPFFNTTGARKEIWVLGLRNPYTFAFQPGTTRMFINDVGEVTWEEINDGIAGSNYGWPITEGPTSDPRFRSPLFAYGHGSTSTTGCAITGGAFYNPTTVQFPSSYVGKYFFSDFCSGWIRVFDPSNSTAADFASGISGPVDLKVTPDGSLYYLALNTGMVSRIQFSPTGPAITTHPANQTVSQGQPATFTVAASGTAPLNYQWQRNMVNISGANSPSYTISPTALADNGAKFRCVVSNGSGTANSNEATLTVTAQPVINTQPASQTIEQGQPVTFTVAAGGSTPLSYQWQRNMSNISGANSPSYMIAATAFADSGAKFRCIVTNGFGTATSNEATLTVTAPPSVTTQPSDQTVTQAQPVTFTVAANGSTPFGYQWQRNMANISGATSQNYTIPSTALADNGAKFRCVVSNGFGSATSNEATLTVQTALLLETEDTSDRAISFDSVTMLRDPYPLTNIFSLGPDNHTRVILFAVNLDLLAGENSSAVTARALDAQMMLHPLTVEFVGKVPGFAWLTEVVVILPADLPAGQEVLVTVTYRAQTSNQVRVKIK